MSPKFGRSKPMDSTAGNRCRIDDSSSSVMPTVSRLSGTQQYSRGSLFEICDGMKGTDGSDQ